MGIVPTLDEVEDRHPCLDLGLEVAAVEQLAFAQFEREVIGERKRTNFSSRGENTGQIERIRPELALSGARAIAMVLVAGARDGNGAADAVV